MRGLRILFACPEGHGRLLYDFDTSFQTPDCPTCGANMTETAKPAELLDAILPGDLSVAHVILATTTRIASASFGYALSLSQTKHILARAGIAFDVMPLHGGAIQLARNRLVSRFLKTKATHLLFVDNDVSWNPHDIVRQVRAGLPLIGGTIATRTIAWDTVREAIAKGKGAEVERYASPICYLPLEKKDGKYIADASGEFLRCQGVPTAFMLLERATLETMCEHYRDLDYWHPEDREIQQMCFDMQRLALFDGDRVQAWSEDYTFCYRWRKIGGEVWVDAVAELGHTGEMEFRTAPLAELLGARRIA